MIRRRANAPRARLAGLLTCVCLCSASAAAVRPLAAQQPVSMDIIRGRVVAPDSQPIADATVTVQVAGGTETRVTRTDHRGSYTVLFPGRTGEYVITIRAIGMAPSTVRVARLSSEDEIITGNVRLATADRVTRLDEVRVRAARPRTGTPHSSTGVGESPVPAGSVLPGQPRERQWDPYDPAQNAVLGTDPSENTLSVNGTVVQTVLPGDGGLTTAATGDPSRGGFSGGNVNLFMDRGGSYHLRTLGVTLAPAGLQWVDAASATVGNGATNWDATLEMFDPLLSGWLRTRSTLTLAQQIRPLPRFPTTPDGLARLGVAADSLERFLGILERAGVPATLPSLPSAQRATRAAWLGRFDMGQDALTNFNLVMNVGYRGTQGAAMSPTALPSSGGSTQALGGFVTANLARYVGNGFLTQLSTTLNPYGTRSEPYLLLPQGRVRIASQLGDAATPGAVSWLTFGGNPSLGGETRRTSWETRSSTSWYSYSGKHRYKLDGGIRTEALRANPLYNALGSFEFRSLEELAAGRATRFTRQTETASQRASGTHLDLSLGDRWDPRRGVSVQAGLRVDRDRVASHAPFNPAIDSLFGRRTDRLPSLDAVSPRLAVSWEYSKAHIDPKNPRALRFPGTLSLVAGRYQSGLNASAVSAASQATGMPSATRILDCVGEAVPIADWSGYGADPATIPGTCADGSGGEPLAVTSPRVLLLGDSYRPPTQWRGTLTWSNTTWTAFRVSLTQSLGTEQSSAVDLNLRATPHFTLVAEAGRPVYVPVSDIVPATGAAATRSSRVTPWFDQVLESTSDLRSTFTQLALSKTFRQLTPSAVAVGYVAQWGRSQQRGFNGGMTAGDPFVPAWGATPVARHGFSLDFGIAGASAVSLRGRAWLRSGIPYTPRVAGDVNGDGAYNDIAFVADPGAATTPDALRASMAELLERAPAAARRCLTAQLGRIAARNSCEGPWTGGLDLQLRVSHRWLKPSDGLEIEVLNAAGAVDRLLHGGAGQRGWGDQAMPDATLLIPSSFDAVARQYRYEVNPRFGRRGGGVGVWHTPVQLRLRMSVPIGASLQTQTNRSVARSARAMRDDRSRIERSLYINNPFSALLDFQGTLRLTEEQRQEIRAVEQRWQLTVDSAATRLVDFLHQLSDTVPDARVAERVQSTRAQIDAATQAGGRELERILTPDQVNLLPRRQRAWVTGRSDGLMPLERP